MKKRKKNRIIGIAPKSRATQIARETRGKMTENSRRRRIAAAVTTKMGITPLELGMLTAARWKAEMTARPDETLQETEARAQELWKKDKAEQEECNRLLSKAMKSITEAAESEETPPWVKENRGWTHDQKIDQ